jgi:hypothetical protein
MRKGSLMAIDLTCNRYGGTNVSRDAWANWDSADQDWELGVVFDYAHCHDCDGETRLVEVDLVTREPID